MNFSEFFVATFWFGFKTNFIQISTSNVDWKYWSSVISIRLHWSFFIRKLFLKTLKFSFILVKPPISKLIYCFFNLFWKLACDIETGQSNLILDIEESRGQRKWTLFSLWTWYVWIILDLKKRNQSEHSSRSVADFWRWWNIFRNCQFKSPCIFTDG